MAKEFTQHAGIPEVIQKFKVIFGQNTDSACPLDGYTDTSEDEDEDDDEYCSTSDSSIGLDDHDLMMHVLQQAHAHCKSLTCPELHPKLAEKNAEELLAEEEREKKKAEKRKAKKKRRREKKKEEKEMNSTDNKNKSSNNNNSNVSKKETSVQSSKKNTSKNVKSKVNGESSNVPQPEQDEKDEEDFLDPNSAFVSVAFNKNKRSTTTAITHMDRSQRATSTKKSNDIEDAVVVESERLAVEGYNAASREQYLEAVDYFTKAIQLVHNDHRFYGNRSFCYCQLGQYAKALKDADKAVKFAPQSPKGYYRRGEALRGLKQYKQAEEAFERVVQLDEDCDDAKQELENVKIQQLMEMGFGEEQAFAAILQYNSVQVAVEMLTADSPALSHNSSAGEIYYSDDEVESFLSAAPSNPEGHLSLWVGNITQNVSEKQLIDLFSKFGVVMSVRLLPEKFCAFINFRDKSAPGPAMKQLQGKEIGGERLLIRYPNNPVPEQITKLTGPVNGDECHFWRTTGCAFGPKCRNKHIKENKGIDKKPWQKAV
ncbi:hypothetical protein C0J52_10575 [Blattella germanica]|nr:hypothetical protein C0J52_10575 [Blattella germanica]